MKQWFSMLVISGLLISAVSPLSAGDLEELQGTWKAVALERKGMPAPDEVVKATRVVIKKDRFELRSTKDPSATKAFTFTIDPTAQPKSMDLTPHQEPDKGKKLPIAIYQLKEDKLIICVANNEPAERPRKFETSKDVDVVLMTLKYVQQAD